MPDLAFYHFGDHETRGGRRVLVPFRRLLRKLLLPIFQRQVVLFQHLCDRLEGDAARLDELARRQEELDRRQDVMTRQFQTSIALGWDYVATVRRLGALEDRVEALLARGSGQGGLIGSDRTSAQTCLGTTNGSR